MTMKFPFNRAGRTIVALGTIALSAACVTQSGALFTSAPQALAAAAPTSAAGTQSSNDTYTSLGRQVLPRDQAAAGWRVSPDRIARDNPKLELRPRDARIVSTTASRTVAAIPSAQAPCLLSQYESGDAGLNCAADAQSTTALVTYGGAMGIVPDAVKTVTFTTSDGGQRVEAIVGNMWQSGKEDASVSFVLRGSQQRIDLMPLSSLPTGAKNSDGGVVTLGTPPEGLDLG